MEAQSLDLDEEVDGIASPLAFGPVPVTFLED
jgi:hypothetical protein